MIKVKFVGKNSRYIGEAKTYDEAYQIMADFIHEAEKNNGFHWFYTRIMAYADKQTIHFDVSSHSEFFDFEFKDKYHFMDTCKALGLM